MSIPDLIFTLLLLAIFGSSVPNLILIIAVLDLDPYLPHFPGIRHECGDT
jgi:ABC-type dipeptide/oligopeptide/nickel transport system permease subunit